MGIELGKTVAGAGEQVVRSAQRRLVQVLEQAETHVHPGALERVAKVADKRGEEGLALVARFQELTKPPAPEPWHQIAHPGYVQDILAGKSILQPGMVFKDLATHTPPASGTHKLAVALDQIQQGSSKRSFYQYAVNHDGNLLQGSLASSEAEVVNRASKIVLRANHGWANSLTVQELLHAYSVIKQMPGLNDAARLHVASAERELAQLLPKMERKQSAWFGLSEKTVVDAEVAQKVNQLCLRTISNIQEATAPLARNLVAEQTKLLERLLDYQINKAGSWKVYSSESWQKFQSASQGNSSGHMSGSSFKERSLFETAINMDVSAAFSGSQNSSGKVAKSVDLPIPQTGVNAPMVSVQHILKGEGDFIVYSQGQIHVLNRGDVAGWFQLAKREAILKARHQ